MHLFFYRLSQIFVTFIEFFNILRAMNGISTIHLKIFYNYQENDVFLDEIIFNFFCKIA